MALPAQAVSVAAAIPFLAILVVLGSRWVRRRRSLDDDREYPLVFPEGPDDSPARGTKAGRALKTRH